MRVIRVLSFLFAIFFINILQGQVILIPNGGFDTDTSGWSITGTDLSISAYGGEMTINVAGVYTRDFILTSPSFHLDSAKSYKLHTDLRNVQEDSMGEQPLGGFDEVNLIDANGQTVADVTLYYFDTSGFLDHGSSNNFNVLASGTYSLEYIGRHNPEAEFIVDNVGLEEIIHNTFSGTVTLDINNDGCASSGTTPEGLPIQLNETNSNTSYNVFTDVNGEFFIETQNITGNFITQTNLALYNSIPLNYTITISSGVNDMDVLI